MVETGMDRVDLNLGLKLTGEVISGLSLSRFEGRHCFRAAAL
jgi:hypothetical protein